MKISYDPEIDALYIRLLRGKHECRSIRLSEEVALNIGPGEKLLGIEILDARSILGSDKMAPRWLLRSWFRRHRADLFHGDYFVRSDPGSA